MNCKILKFFCISFFILNTAQANAFDWFDDDDDKNEGRSYIHIVGSSTISPLMASVSEEFARNHAAKGLIIETPVVESTGTIEGIKIFCGGLGKNHPDFVSASRPINGEEVKQCNENGVKEIAEIKIGYDGIVLVNLIGNPKINLTTEQIFWALAKRVVDKKTGKLIKNPYENWSDIDPSLPNKKIVVYGPPATSGTRDIFIDIVMTGICFSDSRLAALYPDEHTRKEKCAVLRSDGHFIESGENDS